MLDILLDELNIVKQIRQVMLFEIYFWLMEEIRSALVPNEM